MGLLTVRTSFEVIFRILATVRVGNTAVCDSPSGSQGSIMFLDITEVSAVDFLLDSENEKYRAEIDLEGSLSQMDIDLEGMDTDIFEVAEIGTTIYLRLIDGVDRDGDTASPFDDFATAQMMLTCTPSDTSMSPVFHQVILTIVDINDNIPQWVNLEYAFSVNEGSSLGTTVFLAVSATDKDSGANGEVDFAIVPGNGDVIDASPFFKIEDPRAGYIVIQSALDYESLRRHGVDQFSFDLTATDQPVGGNGNVNRTTVTVILEDDDDLGPEFIYATCKTIGPDNICFHPAYSSRIISESSNGLFPAPVPITTYPVPVNADGSSVTIRARDQDTIDAVLVFSIEQVAPSTYTSYFDIITTAVGNGYEAKVRQLQPFHRSEVQAIKINLLTTEQSDRGRHESATIDVHVVPSNLAPSIITSNLDDNTKFVGYIYENSVQHTFVKRNVGESPLRLIVNDPDMLPSEEPAFTFSDDSDVFDVASDGYVYLVPGASLDYEALPISKRFDLEVVVRESDFPNFETTAMVTINVLDVDENSPVFTNTTNSPGFTNTNDVTRMSSGTHLVAAVGLMQLCLGLFVYISTNI